MAKISIIGYGTVGSGVYEIVKKNSAKLSANTNGEPIEVKYILDIRDFDDHPEKELFTKDFDDILNDAEVAVVAETMGGLHPAYEFTKSLLQSGKHVVTSNKELVATYGTELLETALKNNVNYFFEASVGGGIPIIRPMHQCMTANNIKKIAGILNGTTNYILYQMIKNAKTFDEALKDAQSKGYVERNPAADIEGYDACRKIAILASLASGKNVDYNDIKTEGITKITLDDVKYAAQLDCVIKLIGYAEFLDNGSIYSVVCPMIIRRSSPLAGVDDVFNAIMVTGDCVGEVMFYGKGAGKLPTASAVVADIVDAVRHKKRNKGILWKKTEESVAAGTDDVAFAYFIRSKVSAEKCAETFGGIKTVDPIDAGETAFLTKKLTQTELEKKLKELGDVICSIRILD